jgi:transposase
MTSENKTLDFNNQRFEIGIDVHDKSWTATISSNQLVLKTFRMNPDASELARYMNKHYPGGNYYSVYEAGFCGYSVHRKLVTEGISNIIASPTEIPTSLKEKDEKKDPVDSRKLARELANGSLKGIYIPTEQQQELRSLVRLRAQQAKAQARLKNQIKSYLHFCGLKFPGNFEMRHWSRAFIEELRKIEFNSPMGKKQMQIQLDILLQMRQTIVLTLKSIKEFINEYKYSDMINLLLTVPGIGFITAVNIYSELFDIKRFGKFDQLAKFCGLVPSIKSSGDTKISSKLSRANHRKLREMMIEAAWVAVRKDPVLTHCYNEYIKRMSKQEAIIKIAKKLLSRIRFVWINQKPYVHSIIK